MKSSSVRYSVLVTLLLSHLPLFAQGVAYGLQKSPSRDPFAVSEQLREKMPQQQENASTSSSSNTDHMLLNGLSIRLKGIVRAKNNTALLRIDGREQFVRKDSQLDMTAINGKTLAIKVKEIGHDSVTLKIGKQSLTLYVE